MSSISLLSQTPRRIQNWLSAKPSSGRGPRGCQKVPPSHLPLWMSSKAGEAREEVRSGNQDAPDSRCHRGQAAGVCGPGVGCRCRHPLPFSLSFLKLLTCTCRLHSCCRSLDSALAWHCLREAPGRSEMPRGTQRPGLYKDLVSLQPSLPPFLPVLREIGSLQVPMSFQPQLKKGELSEGVCQADPFPTAHAFIKDSCGVRQSLTVTYMAMLQKVVGVSKKKKKPKT